MRIQLLSDLHLGFDPFHPPSSDSDVLVLAGDIDAGLGGVRCAAEWAVGRPVIYLAGNHEYYGEAIPRHTQRLAAECAATGVHFLENRAVEIGGVRFLGCTLWTDFDLFGHPAAGMAAAQEGMNDFRKIRVSPEFRRLRPRDLAALHAVSLRWLVERLDEPYPGRTVVVTHHAPSLRSCRPEVREHPMTPAFASNLEPLLDGRAALWLHGHTHWCVDCRAGGTRVVSNQRGYPGEDTGGFDPTRVITLG